MFAKTKIGMFIIGTFTLVLALVAGLIAHRSLAQHPSSLAVFNNRGNTYCDGRVAPIVFQGDTIGIQLRGFPANANVVVNAVYPDSRIFNVQSVGHVVGIAENPEGTVSIGSGGSAYFDYVTTNEWPLGCYTFESMDTGKHRSATAAIAVAAPGSPEAQPIAGAQNEHDLDSVWKDPALIVVNQETGAAKAKAGEQVELFGEGFGANEDIAITITQPDGSVLTGSESIPDQRTNNAGEFYFAFTFNQMRPLGRYVFAATGKNSGFRSVVPFELANESAPTPAWSMVRVVIPPDGRGVQRTTFQVQGQRFVPGERIAIQLTLPDGSKRDIKDQITADNTGHFSVNIELNEQLPAGKYIFAATGGTSKRSGSADIVLDGSPNTFLTDTKRGTPGPGTTGQMPQVTVYPTPIPTATPSVVATTPANGTGTTPPANGTGTTPTDCTEIPATTTTTTDTTGTTPTDVAATATVVSTATPTATTKIGK